MTSRRSRLATIVALALRDLRGGLVGMRILFASIVIGVMAITGVGAISQSLLVSFSQEGRSLLGGDIALARSLRPLERDERAYLRTLGRISEIATMRAMARASNDRVATVEIKVVDGAYPLVGSFATSPAIQLSTLRSATNGAFGALADKAFVERLNLRPGDEFTLGQARFSLLAEIESEPDRIATGLAFGPRVMISPEALDASGLRSSTSLIRWYARVALDAGDPSDHAVRAMADQILKRFPSSGWDARTRANASPQLSRNIERFTQFLSLIGVVSLIVGGVGVSISVGAFVERKREAIAILKAVGSSGATAFLFVLAEMMTIAIAGALVGAILGAVSPFAFASLAGPLIDLPFRPIFSASSFVTGVMIGLLTALAFIVAPAGRAHDTPVAALFRSAATAESGRLRARYAAMAMSAFVALVAAVYLLSADKKIAIMAIAGVAISAIILRALGWTISRAAALGAAFRNMPVRMALANIRRPGSVTRPVVASLGLGLTLLVTIVSVDGNVQRQLRTGEIGRTPDYFFADVGSAQAADFRALLLRHDGAAEIEQAPMLRGRIVRVAGRPAEEVRADSDSAWALDGDRGITYAKEPPVGSTVVAGRWWPENYSGAPLVSMDDGIARGLGLKIGDEIAVNVMGRVITAKIANLRAVDWRSFGMNFVLVFTPVTFSGAPHTELFTLRASDGRASADGAIVRDVARSYPTVVALNVRDALQQALAMVEKIAIAIRAASSVTLAMALLTLGGALAAGQRARLYDAVVLRMLGASRRQLIGTYLIEFLILGVATSVFALGAGSIAASLIVTQVMKLDFTADWRSLAAIVTVGSATPIILGLMGAWRTLGVKPARVLREL